MKSRLHLTTHGRTVAAAFLAASLALLTAASSAALAQGNVVRFALSVEPGSLDLHADTTTASLDVNQAIYETLVRFDHDMNIVPWLATSWEQPDETTYRFELRDDVTFHSGHPFDAEAVKAHIERMTDPADPGLPMAFLNHIEAVEVLGEHSVEIRLNRPFGPALAYMALPHTAIQDTAHYREIGDDFGVRPSGTGPFRMESWSRGSALNLVANEEYWGGAPAVDGLQFRIMPEPGPRTFALQGGEVHATNQVSIQDIPTLAANPGVEVEVAPEPRYIRWLVNLNDDILADINVRRALTMAIDYEFVVEAILGDFGRVLEGFVIPESIGYLAVPYTHDPEGAAGLLQESGWERNASGIFERDGQTLSIPMMTGNKMPRELELFEAIQNQFRDFGIDLQFDLIEGAQIYPNIARYSDMLGTDETPDFGLLTMDGGMRTGEANNGLETAFRCGGNRNASHYCNPEYDRLLDIAVSGVPLEERLEAYYEAQLILAEEIPAINIWQPSWAIAKNVDLDGYALHPAGVWHYENVSLR
ncbi:MAG: ABC transporter substrate-binding protein [Gemmatimonadaceae bacterium]|nr:ABC transporter substrate-binding protein [Gemmatimonadaceae bacterium]